MPIQLPATKYGRALMCMETHDTTPVSAYSDNEGRPYNLIDDYHTVAILWTDLFPADPLSSCTKLQIPKDAPDSLVRCNAKMRSEACPNQSLGSPFNWPSGNYCVVEGGPLNEHPLALPDDEFSLAPLALTDASLGFHSKRIELVNLFLHLDVVNNVMTYSLACVEWPCRQPPYDQGLIIGPFDCDDAASAEQLELGNA